MVKHVDPLSLTFSALADPTRRAILARLASEPTTVGDLVAPFSMSAPAISKHLGVLERAGLVVRARAGRHRRCEMRPDNLRIAADWLGRHQRFWEERFDALGRYLEATLAEEDRAHVRRTTTEEIEDGDG